MTRAFGQDAYYSDPGRGHEPDWLIDEPQFRKQLPPDARERVERAWKRATQIVRRRLDSQTRLEMTVTVPVKIVDGVPISLADVLHEFEDPDLWWLMAYRDLFSVTTRGLLELLNAFAVPRPLLSGIGADEAFAKSLDQGRGIIQRLLESKQVEQLDERLREIDHDILGAYHFNKPEIHLYWMAIGFFAPLLGVPMDDLTIVVLTHELAHAYTHLGGDVDGTCWETDAFGATDIHIVEGLAQSYTERVVDQLHKDHPGAKMAFEALLKKQCLPYTIFKHWTDSGDLRGEVIRTAMIQTRKSRNRVYRVFHDDLERLAGEPLHDPTTPN
jgi:hypothetical protein